MNRMGWCYESFTATCTISKSPRNLKEDILAIDGIFELYLLHISSARPELKFELGVRNLREAMSSGLYAINILQEMLETAP